MKVVKCEKHIPENFWGRVVVEWAIALNVVMIQY